MRVIMLTLLTLSRTRQPVRDFATTIRNAQSTPTTTALTPLSLKPAFSSQIRDYRSLEPSAIIARRDRLSAKLIKSVKTVNATKKKVYMLYNLEPDHSVTGGAWYTDFDLDSEFVEILNQQCYRFVLGHVSSTPSLS